MNERKKIITLCLFLVLLASATYPQQETKYQLPKGFTGWVFLVGTDDASKIKHQNGFVRILTDGFGYRKYNSGGMKVYDDEGTDISDQARLLMKATLTHHQKQYEIFEFYIPDAQTKALGEDIWFNTNPFKDSLDFQKRKLEKSLLDKYIP